MCIIYHVMWFIAVISCILAEHSQMKSSHARFRKLVQLGKDASSFVCLYVLMNMATQCTSCVIVVVLVCRFFVLFCMCLYMSPVIFAVDPTFSVWNYWKAGTCLADQSLFVIFYSAPQCSCRNACIASAVLFRVCPSVTPVDNHTVIDFIKETHFYHQL